MGVLFCPHSIYFHNEALDGGREEIHVCRCRSVGYPFEDLASISFVVIVEVFFSS